MLYRLTDEIIALSESDNWELAKFEWNFIYAYMSEEYQTCLCGRYPIQEICVIKNKKNGNETEVGNCCVNKFLGINRANKIFTSLKRVKKDISKSMSAETLDYLYNKNAINEFEYNFYSDIIRKRILSKRQSDIKKQINEKLIAFTSYEPHSNFIKINKVLHWAKNNPDFDDTFILSLKERCTKNGMLTDKQKKALESIMEKWKIE